MTFPRPDVAVEEFPAADAGTGGFPFADAGVEVFPPSPTPTILVAVALTMSPVALVAVLPWRDSTSLLTMSPAAVMSASVEIEAVSVLEMVPELSPVHEMAASGGLEMAPAAVMLPEVALMASTALALTAGIQGTPVAVVTADAITTLSVSATVAIAGVIAAPAGLAITPAAIPTALVTQLADTALTLAPAAALQVITFVPSGMLRNTSATSRFGTSFSQVVGWTANTATYPGSTVVSSDLISQTAAVNGTIEVSVQFQNASAGARILYLQVTVAGTPVGTVYEQSFTGASTAFATFSVPNVVAAAGAAIRLEARANFATSILSTGNTSSYVRIVQP